MIKQLRSAVQLFECLRNLWICCEACIKSILPCNEQTVTTIPEIEIPAIIAKIKHNCSLFPAALGDEKRFDEELMDMNMLTIVYKRSRSSPNAGTLINFISPAFQNSESCEIESFELLEQCLANEDRKCSLNNRLVTLFLGLSI